MKKKILIVGGSGFIGHNLIKSIYKLNYKITSLSSKFVPKKKKFQNVDYIICDIFNLKNLERKLIDNFDYVINLSGNIDHKEKYKTIRTHYIGCKNLVNIFKKKNIKLFIQVGSSLEYGSSQCPHIESDVCFAKSVYGKAKLDATNYLKKVNKKFNFPYIILRLYQVYGPYQKFDRLIPAAIQSFIRNEKFQSSHGSQLRDFIYIKDLVVLFHKILNKKKVGVGIYNVGTGNPISVKYAIETINREIGLGKILFGDLKMRRNEMMRSYPSIKKVKKFFNWRPKTSFLKGIKKTIKYYNEIC